MQLLCAAIIVSAMAMQDPSSQVTIIGVVREPNGNPVADAEVFLAAISSTPEEHDHLPRVTSGPDGAYSLSIERSELARLDCVLMAHKPGFGISFGDIRPGATPDPIDIQLKSPQPIRLTVVDPNQKPVANARVCFAGYHGIKLGCPLAPIKDRFIYTTNAAGQVTINDLCDRSGMMLALAVETKEFGTQVGIGLGRDAARLELTPVTRIHGQVTVPEGFSAKNLKVVVKTSWEGQNPFCPQIGYASAITDATGNYEIPAIIAGTSTITVQQTPPREIDHIPLPVRIKSGEGARVDVKMEPLKWVVGRCIEVPNRKPLPGVCVILRNQFIDQEQRTNDAGEFRFRLIPGKYGVLLLNHRGWIRPSRPSSSIQISESFGDGETPSDAIFEFERGANLSGTVVDEVGRPVAKATVAASWQQLPDPEYYPRDVAATSNDQGEFTLVDVWQGGPLRIAAYSAEAATVTPVDYSLDRSDPLQLVVYSDEAIHVTGRVTDVFGRNLPATVSVWEINRSVHGKKFGNRIVQDCFNIPSDQQGNFVVTTRLVRSQEYELTVRAEGFRKKRVGINLGQSASRSLDLPNIVLEPGREK